MVIPYPRSKGRSELEVIWSQCGRQRVIDHSSCDAITSNLRRPSFVASHPTVQDLLWCWSRGVVRLAVVVFRTELLKDNVFDLLFNRLSIFLAHCGQLVRPLRILGPHISAAKIQVTKAMKALATTRRPDAKMSALAVRSCRSARITNSATIKFGM